ncbi:MAG: FkbM family methyltransferase [Acidobacteriaceae bacterium]
MEPPSALAALSGCSAESLVASLQEILSEPLRQVEDREHSALAGLLQASNDQCVLFGAGSLGQRALAELKASGIHPLAISDNDRKLWGTQIEGTPLLSPSEAAARYGKQAVFFITIRNERHWYRETFEQLTGLGCAAISSAAPLGWRFPDKLLPFLLYDLPHKLYAQAEQVLLAAQLWQDDASRVEYLAQVRLRALGDPSGLCRPPADESYFLEGIFELRPRDVFVDCGAYDGDTIRDVVSRQPRFGKVEAVEADTLSFAKLAGYVASLQPEFRGKIRMHHCAVGATLGTVRFEDSGTVDSRVSDTGETVADLVPLDVMFASKHVSMIKMDIEGGEFDALQGARQVIQRDRPILAICVYHFQQDLWRLPLLMRSMVPDCRMYLKAYRGDGIQTVAYAVPSERLLRE